MEYLSKLYCAVKIKISNTVLLNQNKLFLITIKTVTLLFHLLTNFAIEELCIIIIF